MSWITFEGAYATPGINAARDTIEAAVGWGPFEYNRAFMAPALIDGAARDAGGSPTTLLRPGLLMGMNTSTKKHSEWDPAAVDGTEHLSGIILTDMHMQVLASDQDRWYWVLVGGNVKASALIVPGASSAGIAGNVNEFEVRRQMQYGGRYLLDDDHWRVSQGGWRGIKSMETLDGTGANTYTVLTTDHDTLFHTVGTSNTSTFTLPPIAKSRGLRYGFYAGSDFDVTVVSAEGDNIIAFNDIAADSVALSTASEIVGGFIEIIGLDNTKWASIVHLAAETQTPVIAT